MRCNWKIFWEELQLECLRVPGAPAARNSYGRGGGGRDDLTSLWRAASENSKGLRPGAAWSVNGQQIGAATPGLEEDRKAATWCAHPQFCRPFANRSSDMCAY